MPLKVSDGIEAWIDDFRKSDAPQFKGKNKEERRDMAVAAYLSAKRGPLKDEQVRQEAMTAKQKAEYDRQIAAFKAKGGKIKKLAPGKAAGYHGKDDLGTGMKGMLDKGDTRGIGTRKKARSMRASYDATKEWQEMYGDVILENAKLKKIKQLGMLGLVDKGDVQKLMTAMKAMDAGKEVPKNQRAVIFDAFNSLIDLVTGDTTVFQKAKKSVKEEVIGEGKKEKTYVRMMQNKVQDVQKVLDPKSALVKKVISDTGKGKEFMKIHKMLIDVDDMLGDIEMNVKEAFNKKAPKMTYALVGKDMKIYSMGSDERDLKLDRRSLEKRFKDAAPLKLARLKTAQSLGDKVDKSQLKEEVEKDPNEYDNEGEMMKDHLDIIMDAADEIYDIVDDDENLPEWCQNKITKGADYIDSVRDYLMSQERDEPEDATNEAIRMVKDTNAMTRYKMMVNKGQVDDDGVRMAIDNPKHPEVKRLMKDKKFKSALDLYKQALGIK